MPHVTIFGRTESGKTTLAKQLAQGYIERDIKVLILDPLSDPGWPQVKGMSYQTSDRALFMHVVRQSQKCAVFVDESGEMIGQHSEEMFWLATRARHYGHNSHFISQRASQVNPTVRTQAGRLFLFRVSATDAKILSDEWAAPILREANSLKQFEFYDANGFDDPVKRRVELPNVSRETSKKRRREVDTDET